MADGGVWVVKVYLEATECQAADAEGALARALCPSEDHDGYCPVPWTMEKYEAEDQEGEEWQQFFDDQRRSAREAGEPGA